MENEILTHSLLIVVVIGVVNALLRFLPDLIFRKHKTPRYLTMLGKVLPHAIMGMLVVYCWKDVTLLSYPYGLPELISCAVVAGLHLWKKNSLLSIGCGVVCYMLLVQLVFV